MKTKLAYRMWDFSLYNFDYLLHGIGKLMAWMIISLLR